MKSPVSKPSDFPESWYLVDGKDMVLGRIASRIALLLQGKANPRFVNHLAPNVHVVVVNARHIALTGKKYDDKEEELFYYHTGYPGGIRSETYRQTLEGKHPERVMMRAIKRMLPKNSPRARAIMRCVRVYAEADHPHSAQEQKMTKLDFGSVNRKNVRVYG